MEININKSKIKINELLKNQENNKNNENNENNENKENNKIINKKKR